MGADIEYRNPYVVAEMKKRIKWFTETTGVNGMRLDALKHIDSDFLHEWVSYIKSQISSDCHIIGEYWNG